MLWTSHWYGKTEYSQSMKIMEACAIQAGASGAGEILGFEYDRIITLGIRGTSEDISESTNIPIVSVQRGGQATVHNPGQLIVYPVFPIKKQGLFAKEWVSTINEATIRSLSLCNIIVISQNNGIYTSFGKIASIGINIKRGVSTHGIAINLSNNLDDFSQIIPCGVAGQKFDQVAAYKNVPLEEFFELWCKEFSRVLERRCDDTLTRTHLET
jgi:lipoyl(octanoyl) transferase